MQVTVVIPCYNQAKYLKDAIKSVMAQTVKCKIIVVNDGSTDDTNSIAEKYDVVYIEQPNKGLSAARNAGIKAAKTHYVLPLDADDKLHGTMVEKCLKEIPYYDIVSANQRQFQNSNALVVFPERPTHESFLQGNQLHCTAIFKKEMWKALGGYDENMKFGYEDWDFWVRATKHGYSVKTIQDYLFFYRKHGNSMINDAHARHKQLHKYILDKLK